MGLRTDHALVPPAAPAVVTVRLLVPGDEVELDRFLDGHADSSMFLRSNIRAGGVVDQGMPYQGRWFGAFDGERLTAVAMHAWNGNLIVQADSTDGLPELVRATVTADKPVAGIIGPYAHVVATRTALGLDSRKANLENKERLYALDLGKLIVPHGAVHVRPTRDDDLDLCETWRIAYCQEALSMPLEEAKARARDDVERTHRRGDSFVLADEGGTLVAYSAFNARVPDMVQVGGVWTPKEERRHGHGRAVVAGSLVLARALGVTRAILFTGEWNTPAQRAYEALGFERIGDFGLITFGV